MYHKIMVPLDGSELAECVLPHVDAFIKGFKCSDVFFVRVVETETGIFHLGHADLQKVALDIEERRKSFAGDYLDQVAERSRHEGTVLHSEVLAGRVAENLIEYARNNGIDLIIMATHGRSGVTRWIMGSVADKLLRTASVPVLMVRAPGAKGRV
jgi:nucleotide-binding universal stress UspA family protein